MRRVYITSILATFVVAGGAATLGHQTPASPEPPPTGAIAGRVFDALTGAPVAGITVTLSGVLPATFDMRSWRPGDPRPGVQVTGPNGQFEYTALPAGRFRLTTRGGGYLWGALGMRAAWDIVAGNPTHELRSGERISNLELRL